ncbi:hypothetical protein AAEO50_16610 [Rossellomorea oryzaecorticis]|uniref:Uncharacterized protein n=1 Tax=Rossellomorea oryzaecorticis TaxID=1396505 RepID=A0ABU9KCR9_9BACI
MDAINLTSRARDKKVDDGAVYTQPVSKEDIEEKQRSHWISI